ncbi:unnamed protein product [Triticum turgidum subsp. durum]|uniref:Uncharacterized protein n=1 Tax=Triticum turgidum subsp. durum TaxID=4567 RepID=A0A9R1AYZ7_TRITD|nr:unnamed protein product [Triticum turgidum subsp. durum]
MGVHLALRMLLEEERDGGNLLCWGGWFGRRRVLLEEGGGDNGVFAGVGSGDGGTVAGVGGVFAGAIIPASVDVASVPTIQSNGQQAWLLGRMLNHRDMSEEIDFILADGTGAI